MNAAHDGSQSHQHGSLLQDFSTLYIGLDAVVSKNVCFTPFDHKCRRNAYMDGIYKSNYSARNIPNGHINDPHF